MSRNTWYLVTLWSFVAFMLLFLTLPAMFIVGPWHPYPYCVLGGFVGWRSSSREWAEDRRLANTPPLAIRYAGSVGLVLQEDDPSHLHA